MKSSQKMTSWGKESGRGGGLGFQAQGLWVEPLLKAESCVFGWMDIPALASPLSLGPGAPSPSLCVKSLL